MTMMMRAVLLFLWTASAVAAATRPSNSFTAVKKSPPPQTTRRAASSSSQQQQQQQGRRRRPFSVLPLVQSVTKRRQPQEESSDSHARRAAPSTFLTAEQKEALQNDVYKRSRREPPSTFLSAEEKHNLRDDVNEHSWVEDDFGTDLSMEESQDDADVYPLPSLSPDAAHSLLKIPCILENPAVMTIPMTTIVDTGAQATVLSYEGAQKAGVLGLVDRRYAGHATGVGNCRILGRIPAGALRLRLDDNKAIPSPPILVLEKMQTGVELLLGLDFLRDHKATLSLSEETMTLYPDEKRENEAVVVAFARPRDEWENDNYDEDDDEEEDDYARMFHEHQDEEQGGASEASYRQSQQDDYYPLNHHGTDDDYSDGGCIDMSGV